MDNKTLKNEYESYVSKQQGISFMQSEKWSRVKTDWLSEQILLKDECGYVHGAVQMLIKKIPFLHTAFIYAPRGPVCDMHDKYAVKRLTELIRLYAQKYNAFMVRIDPMIDHSDTQAIGLLTSAGFRYDPNRSEDDMIQSQKNYILNIAEKTSEQVFDSFHPKWRYNIRTAIRKGVLCVADKSRLDDFYTLMQETGKRDNFCIRSNEYYRKLLAAFGKNARLYMCYSPQDMPLSGAISICYGDRVSYVYGASTAKQRNLMPNYLMQWQMINWAIDSGCRTYDFMGVPHFDDESHPNFGVYRFKKGFNGTAVKYAGEFDLILSEPKYRLARYILRMKGYKKI